MSYTINELRDLIDRHRGEPSHRAAIPGLRLQHAAAPNPRINTIYRPSLCLLAQGSKQVFLGDKVFAYDPSQYLIVTVDLPVTGCIVEAGPGHPYLGLSLDLDPELIADLLLEMPWGNGDMQVVSGLAVSQLDEDLLDCVVRLLQLLDRSDDVTVMAPIIKREIHYRLLRGEQGTILRNVVTADSHLSRIRRAIEWIRVHYEKPVSVAELATHASMSITSFHRHFKSVTLMTPLQYRRLIRLQEARRLLLVHPQDVATIGFTVGYDSPSQFSREYHQMFGMPPAADAERIRG